MLHRFIIKAIYTSRNEQPGVTHQSFVLIRFHGVLIKMRCTAVVCVLERNCSNASFDLQFDEEIMGRQEALAQLLKQEEKINQLEAELQAFRSQVLFFFSSFLLKGS